MKKTTLTLLIAALASQVSAAESLIKLPPDSWSAQTGTKLRSVLYKGTDMGDAATIIEAWSGAALDPVNGNLMVWGGGLGNYKGNEIYQFNVETLKWVRLTDPCTNFGCSEPNPCGQAIVRHTYNGLSYMTHANQMFVHGGAFNCDGKGCTLHETWTFDVASKAWKQMHPGGQVPSGNSCGNNSAYDPATKRVYYTDDAGFYSYNLEANAWTRHDTKGSYYQTGTLDFRRGLYVQVGAGTVTAYDIRKGNFTRQTWATSGDQSVVQENNPGVEYDPYSDRIVSWSGGSAFALNADTKVWEKKSASGAPSPSDNGIFGRWRYVPSSNVFVCVTSIDDDVHFYKATEGAAPQWVLDAYKNGVGILKKDKRTGAVFARPGLYVELGMPWLNANAGSLTETMRYWSSVQAYTFTGARLNIPPGVEGRAFSGPRPAQGLYAIRPLPAKP